MSLRMLFLTSLTLSALLSSFSATAQNAPPGPRAKPKNECRCKWTPPEDTLEKPFAPLVGQDEVIVDLKAGQVWGKHGAVRVQQSPRDTDRNGYQEAVLAVNLKGYRGLEVEAVYDQAPEGFSLNVGDSRTNNGYAGDAATQTNDAEFEVQKGHLRVWGNDNVPQPNRKLGEWKNAVRSGTRLFLKVADGELRWKTSFGDALASGQALSSGGLFALDGQPDREGPVNYDVYLGLNQVVSGGRRGSGLAKVRVRLVR